MITRTRHSLEALLALATLVLMVVGLPVVLYRSGGSPLPSHVPDWQRVTAVLTSRDDGTVVLGIFRSCAWLAWLLFTTCVVAEAQAAIRGRRAPRLRLGGMQGAAAHLVALSALAFTAPSAVTLSASVTAASQPAFAPVAGHLAGPAPPPAVLTAYDGTTSRLVTVRPGDCLWLLAQHYLGEGDRYREIVNLNKGHHMGSGRVFTNPSLIEPGWRLLLPVGAATSPAHPASARHHLGHPTADQHYRRRHRAATDHPAQQPAVHTQQGNGAAAPSRAFTPRADVPEPTGAVGGHVGYQSAANANRAGALAPDTAAFVTGALAGAVLTSLIRLRRWQRQHRRRGRRIVLPADPDVLATEQRLRATVATEQVETLRDALVCLEASIVNAGVVLPDIIGLHVTSQVLELLLAEPAPDAPPAPFAISPGRQGMCWKLDLPATVTVPADVASRGGQGLPGLDCHLLPGLITAGATDSGFLLLDLESMQVLGCDGPQELVDQVVATIATELATGQWSGWYDLILVGCDELADIGRAEHCPTLSEAIDLLETRGAIVAQRIAVRAPADVRELRLAEPDNEDWGLTVLVSRAEPSAEEMTRLLHLVEDGPGGVAAVLAGDPESDDGRMAPTVIQVAPDPERPDGIIANVVPLQITVRPRALSAAEYDAIGSLLAAAADLDDVGQDEQPYVAYGAPPWIAHAGDLGPEPAAGRPSLNDPAELADTAPDVGWVSDENWAAAENLTTPEENWAPEENWTLQENWAPEEDWAPDRSLPTQQVEPRNNTAARGLEIRILGQFAILGTAEQLQPKQAELVLALALAAPAGLSNSALSTMLGADPDHPKPADAVRQIITRARRRLGRASDGQEYIIHAGNGQYVLHSEAVLDWSRFRQLLASGRAEDLRAAVSLITGQPFAGSYFWWIDLPLAETVRAEVVDAAETLAEFELAVGAPRSAAKAARAGLLADSTAEQLWRAVMRAENAAGNLAGVAEAWRRCLAAIEDIAPDGEPHPDTAALYRQITDSAHQHAEAR